METFETVLAHATDPATREVLAAIGLVINGENKVLYSHASGPQNLSPSAPPLDETNTIALGSAGKFITHIAALQLVEQGLIGLDEPVFAHLPELAQLSIISRSPFVDPDSEPTPESFSFQTPTNPITLRHLLTHSSGIGSPSTQLIQDWKKTYPQPEFPPHAHPIVKKFTFPLLFEPGEGHYYGSSIAWLSLLIQRASGKSMPQNVQEHIFDVLGMRSSTYMPQERPELVARRLQMVEREKSSLVADETVPQDLMISIEDFRVILADLISSQSKLLRKESIAPLFTPQFPEDSAALSDLRTNPESLENYTVPAGIPPECKSPLVNYTCAGLYVEDTLPLSHFPKGTTTWNGMPNIIWAINPEKKLAMLFATQLLPVDDEKVVAIAMEFFRCAWATFV